MSEETALVLSETRAIARDLATATNIPGTLQKKPGDVLAIVLAGKELGLGPMQAIRGFDIIQGKISMSSQMIGALIMSNAACEYLTPVVSNDKVATFKTKRRGAPAEVEMSFTIDEAKLAGLTGKDNWKKNPTAMLLARAQARIGRAVYPDLVLGIYDRDSGELIDGAAPVAADAPTTSISQQIKAQMENVVDGEVVSSTVAPAQGEPSQTQPSPTQPAVVTHFAGSGVVAEFTAKINAAATAAELKALIPALKALTPADAKALRPVFDARKGQVQ